MIGRCKVGGKDVGLLLTYQPGKYLRHQTLLDVFKRRAIDDTVQVEMIGILRAPRKLNLRIEHAGGSSSGGIVRLYLNGKEHSVLGDDRKKSLTDDVGSIPAGNHAIRWLITGGNIGACRLQFSDSDTGKALEVVFSRNHLDAFSRSPTRAKVDVSSP